MHIEIIGCKTFVELKIRIPRSESCNTVQQQGRDLYGMYIENHVDRDDLSNTAVAKCTTCVLCVLFTDCIYRFKMILSTNSDYFFE